MSQNRKSSPFRHALRMESLEARQLMAGDVTVQLLNGNLTINEATGHVGEGSNVSVARLANGNIRVSSITNPIDPNFTGVKSLVNGQAFVDIVVPVNTTPNFNVNMGDGNDSIHVVGNPKFNNVSILMSKIGAGNTDADFVDIRGLTTKGSLNIETGAGDDRVVVKETQVGDGVRGPYGEFDDLNVRTGTGSDIVTVGDTGHWMSVKGNLRLYTATDGSVNEAGVDRVYVNLVDVTRDSTFFLGGGDDTLDVLALTTGMVTRIVAGEGNDQIKLRDVYCRDGLFAKMGDGDDTLVLNNVDSILSGMELDGGAGRDVLSIDIDSTAPSILKTNWEPGTGNPLAVLK